ncbi:MAG: radical SAM protein [Acidobacteria bacterium]|nr:MAG: radical SAM protein [Acidobacteriota bacterium]
MNRVKRKRVTKYADWVIARSAGLMFDSLQFFNKYKPNPSFIPKWSDKPVLKSWQKTKPTLGWPRETDSLCPGCVKEARDMILSGEEDWKTLINEKVGEIKAQIIERDGQVWMVKECPIHGRYEDIMSIDSKFLSWIEQNFPGRDIPAHNDKDLHNHGSSSIRYGRGAVLTVDLTNRCNMMCDPCFMDANQVGYVHELTWDEIKEILDNAVKIKPKRQMSVQFSGGEPTLSPYFLDATRYARQLGYVSVQAATNGIEFARSKEFCKQAYEAGLRLAYLQFDGIGNDANSHRQVGNLFDVKLRAIENLHEAGIGIVPVITIVNGVNNDQVGPVIRFAIDNPDKIDFVSFQPVSFTGRDEDITPERRLRQRYTLSHLAYDVKKQVGIGEPTRDWFPLSLYGAFADFADTLRGPQAEWGQVSCGCHPNCGVATALMVNKQNKDWAPVPQFLDIPGLTKDLQKVTDAARGKRLTSLMAGLAVLKHYKPFQAPASMGLTDLIKTFDMLFALSGEEKATKAYGHGGPDRTFEDTLKRRNFPWNVLVIGGMWFQDLFNYDFRRTEMCIIPYATQLGEISFCAYNTGIGWRKIIENMYKSASVSEWYKTRGKHEIYAKGKNVNLDSTEHSLKVNPEDADRVRVRTSDGPMTAAEEERARRRAAREAQEARRLYEETVLKKPSVELVQIAPPPSSEEPVAETQEVA